MEERLHVTLPKQAVGLAIGVCDQWHGDPIENSCRSAAVAAERRQVAIMQMPSTADHQSGLTRRIWRFTLKGLVQARVEQRYLPRGLV